MTDEENDKPEENVKDTLMRAFDQMTRVEEDGGECKHIIVAFVVDHDDDSSTLSWQASPTQNMWERKGMLREIIRRMDQISDFTQELTVDDEDEEEDDDE